MTRKIILTLTNANYGTRTEVVDTGNLFEVIHVDADAAEVVGKLQCKNEMDARVIAHKVNAGDVCPGDTAPLWML